MIIEKQMRKLSAEELPEVLPIDKGRTTMLRAKLLELKVGEGLFLPKEEWKTKNGPYYVVAYIKKTHGFKYDYGIKTDRTGWLFKRVK